MKFVVDGITLGHHGNICMWDVNMPVEMLSGSEWTSVKVIRADLQAFVCDMFI